MKLIPVEKPEDFLLAQQFLLPHEETCVSLASLVRRKAENLFFISLGAPTTLEKLLGIISLEHTLYFCIPDCKQINAGKLADLLLASGKLQKKIGCISGEVSGAELLSEIIGLLSKKEPAQKNRYKMMELGKETSLTGAASGEGLSGGEEIIRCTENDMESLAPLQKEYLKEEVAIPGRKISDLEVSIMLRQILKNQLCLSLYVDGEPVAKANTNAIGIRCIQIGGVFTHPLYRRNGYAGCLVRALAKRAQKAGKKPVLFVKEKNTPALTLYQKLAFVECGGYEIVYY